MNNARFLGAVSAIALMVGFSVGAHAATAVIDGITVTDSGLASPMAPDYSQPAAYSAIGAALQTGWNGSSLSNTGWDPYGPADTTHQWWNIGNSDGSVGFNLSGSSLSIVWGSPNDNNTVSFFSGANGTGSLIGAVSTPDLVTAFNVGNYDQPGYLISFQTPAAFESVAFSTTPTAFEFSVTGVPELSTWGMMLAGFASLGLVGYRRQRREALLAA